MSKFGVYLDAMKAHNYLILNCCFFDLHVGRPVVPFINSIVDKWEQSTVNKVLKYYRALKAQTDADLYYQTNYDDDCDIYSGEFVYPKQEAMVDWDLKMQIWENEPYVPIWLKVKIDAYIEKYYERRYLDTLRKEVQDEIEE